MSKELAQQLISVIAGFLLLLHGFQAFERNEEKTAILFVFISFIFFAIAGSRKWLLVCFKRTDAWFYLAQAAALFYSGYKYKVESNKYFLIVSVLLAVVYLLYSLKLFRDRRKRRKKYRKQISGR